MSKEKFFDDMAKMAGGSISILGGLSQQIKEEIRIRVEDIAHKMDLVPRSDIEKLEAMIVKMRQQQEDQEKRLQALEKKKTTKKKKTVKPDANKT